MAELEAVEARLQRLLDPYRDRLEAFEIYGVPMLRRPGAKSHDWFAGVQRVNGAVKFSFLPMHPHPELLEGVSAALRERKTGASVFKFAQVDEALFVELEALLARSFDSYMGGGS
jgi:7-keto-8-aminopelargonate synthetase-like enzyme